MVNRFVGIVKRLGWREEGFWHSVHWSAIERENAIVECIPSEQMRFENATVRHGTTETLDCSLRGIVHHKVVRSFVKIVEGFLVFFNFTLPESTFFQPLQAIPYAWEFCWGLCFRSRVLTPIRWDSLECFVRLCVEVLPHTLLPVSRLNRDMLPSFGTLYSLARCRYT